MTKHLRPIISFLFLSSLLIGCGSQRAGGGEGAGLNVGSGSGSGGGGDFGSGSDFDLGLNDNGTLDLAEGFESSADNLEDSFKILENTAGADTNLIQGMDAASGTLGGLAEIFTQLTAVQTPQQIIPLLPLLQNAKLRAQETAQLLWQLGLPELARVFAEEARKREVLRFYNPSTDRHFFTTSAPEGVQAQVLYGYRYEGVAFRVYDRPRHECKRALYRCYVPQTDDHFMSTRADCEGRNREGAFGYICAQRRVYAYPPIYRAYSGRNDHLATLSQPELAHITSVGGWRYEGVLGYAPN